MKKGFTIIELLVVISIIGLLSIVVSVILSSSRNRAGVANSTAQVREIIKAMSFYLNDTGVLPPNCRTDCTTLTDPFNNALGVSGWNGPYIQVDMSELTHPWGGHIGFSTDFDLDEDGTPDPFITLDDDRPGTGSSDNGGVIPTNSLIRIDELVDDGNIETGNARADGNGWSGGSTGVGEIIIRFSL